MQLACPNCGTRAVRLSRPNGLGEYFKSLVGVSQLRCRQCKNRWETSVWASGAWKYARCPRCYRQELTTWNPQYYNPPRWTLVLLRVGATRFRCEACRCNFASFRPRKAKFARQHQILAEPAPRTQAEQESILLSGQTPPVEEPGDQMP